MVRIKMDDKSNVMLCVWTTNAGKWHLLSVRVAPFVGFPPLLDRIASQL
jgi:hypothetical protein